MTTKNKIELQNAVLDTVSGGVALESIQDNFALKENERSLIMKDLLHGLAFETVAPECTDIRR